MSDPPDARRVFYAALTRARETLILEWPDYLMAGKAREDLKPSYARPLHVDSSFHIDPGGAFRKNKPLAMRLTRVTAAFKIVSDGSKISGNKIRKAANDIRKRFKRA